MTVSSPNRDLILVLGGETIGVAVVESVLRDHDNVLFLDSDLAAVESAAALGVTAEAVDITSGQALEAALPDADAFGLAIVAPDPDATALLVGQLAKTKFDVSRVIVLVNEPQNRVAFETAGMIPVCATTSLADAVAATHSWVLLCDSDRQSGSPAPASNASQPGRPV